MLQRFTGSEGLPDYKRVQLLAQLQKCVPAIKDVTMFFVYYVETLAGLSEGVQAQLEELLEARSSSLQHAHDIEVVEVGPRSGTVSPWSSRVCAILRACDISEVTAVERSQVYYLSTGGSVLTGEDRVKVSAVLYDRMTQSVYDKPLDRLDSIETPSPVRIIPLLERGMEALHEENKKLGILPRLLEYIADYFRGLGRNPTEVELFMFAQLNSDHCRHHKFSALFDGPGIGDESPFDLVRSTFAHNPGNVAVAFEDNAAVLGPVAYLKFMPGDCGPAPFIVKAQWCGAVIKIETHNHPTSVSAYAGAATGMAASRDTEGTGRGAMTTGYVACYYVARLMIPGYVLPWEAEYILHPAHLQVPLEILVQASNGACDKANCYGNPVILGTCRTAEFVFADGEHTAYIKTIFAAGSTGIIDEGQISKGSPAAGMLLVQIGGPAYRIGLGGGSGSSVDSGAQSVALDFDSVQRADPAMERAHANVIVACADLGEHNPIVTQTDLGAGGDSVGPIELVHPLGARIQLRAIPVGDPSLATVVIMGNEAQERMVVLILPKDRKLFASICDRERCPYAVIGVVSDDGRLIVEDEEASKDSPAQRYPADLAMGFLLETLPRLTLDAKPKKRALKRLRLPNRLTFFAALDRVLRLLSVCDKSFLTRKGDRSVGGLVVQQQCVGALHLPLADCAVEAYSFMEAEIGRAIALGEQPIIGLIDSMAGARMSIAEAYMNIAAAYILGDTSAVSLSATWQWPCEQPGENYALYQAVKATADFCKALESCICVGKDSLSMSVRVAVDQTVRIVKSPGTVQMATFGDCDMTRILTPDIKLPGESQLMFIDLANGRTRMGGSALAQVHKQTGNQCPDADPTLLINGFMALQELKKKNLVLSYHDRSGGGLLGSVLEMAFGGNCGLKLKAKSKATPLRFWFNEELGAIVEFLPAQQRSIRKVLSQHGLKGQVLGSTVTGSRSAVHIRHNGAVVLDEPMEKVRAMWRETSFQLDALQANPEMVAQERINTYHRDVLPYNLTFDLLPTPSSWLEGVRPKVAVIREVASNGYRELAGALWMAGFEPWDVTMTDLIEGRVHLRGFKGIAFAGGFSFADALGAGRGWAAVLRHHPRVSDEFKAFIARKDTFIFGPCNGCQMMTELGVVPGPDWQQDEIHFRQNVSGIFESRFSTVKINPGPSIFFRGMEGSTLGIWVDHGEGQFTCAFKEVTDRLFRRQLVPLQFVDDSGKPTMSYPFNPNGSREGITGLTSPDGRFLAIMPHPERLFQKWQWPYWPRQWHGLKASPWLKVFQNAREWCNQN